MKKLRFLFLLILFASCTSIDKSKETQITNRILQFISIIRTKGVKKALKDTEKINKNLVEDYIFVVNSKGILLAHKNKNLIGVSIFKIKDAKNKNKSLGKEFFKLVKNYRQGWYSYYWKKADGKIGKKRTFLIKVGNLIIGSGYFLN